MSETIAGLIDRLTVVNLKLWFVQDKVYKAAADGTGLDPDTTAQVANLNLLRNKLMAEIDKAVDAAIKSGSAEVDLRTKVV